MKIGIIGAGDVGGTLGRRWAGAGHEVRYGVRDPGAEKVTQLLASTGSNGSAADPAGAASFGQVVVIATPWPATEEAIRSAGNLSGKTVIDCTNPIAPDFSGLSIGHTTSAGEAVQAWVPGAKVVKAFNTIGANIMENPEFSEGRATLVVCGDDGAAKEIVCRLGADLGFDALDAGPLSQARYTEAAAWLWISMALKHGYGREMAFRLMRR